MFIGCGRLAIIAVSLRAFVFEHKAMRKGVLKMPIWTLQGVAKEPGSLFVLLADGVHFGEPLCKLQVKRVLYLLGGFSKS